MFKKNYSERIADIKNVFQSTLEKSENLSKEITESIQSKTEEIVKIQSEIVNLEAYLSENSTFADKLRNLLS